MIRSLQGKSPKIHPTAFVSEFAYLIGDIEIGAHASIWPGVVLRSDRGKMTIGARTNIQDGSICHADGNMDIGADVTLGHAVVCHARSVGDHCLLGNNCTLNDRSSVGEWCILAAGAVLIEGRTVPDNSIAAGVPAKVLGPMAQKHYDLVKMNADEYVTLGRQYKAEGTLEASAYDPRS
jgi:carbonic anhydrase/acetyltransferase-like protein (isoleucine patch superfamily)